MNSMPRRVFLRQAAVAAMAAWASKRVRGTPVSRRWRAAIIGCTGQGDYGHGLESAFRDVEKIEVVGLADPDEAGRGRAAERAKAKRQYSDFREMLARERPELVVVAPRWSEGHFEMAKAALETGAHILTEKPFTATLAEADILLAAGKRKGLRIAVAHQMRLAPAIIHLQRLVADGGIGELVQMHSWGKQDTRAGGEDLIVLGTHVFDIMRLFAGDAASCNSRVLDRGREITRADAHPATERIGPIAGDEIEAQFGFANGVAATFTSRARLRETLGPWGVELLGSKGAVRILMNVDPIVLQRQRNQSAPTGTSIVDQWLPLADEPGGSPGQNGFGRANTRVVLDWLSAIEDNREPQCSGENAMKALEFVMAIYESALEHRTARFPLAKREHPLA